MNVPRDHSRRGVGVAQSLGEVYIEHLRMGKQVKVSAIHAETATEVSIVGPASASQSELETIAVNKLKYVMAKKTR